MRITAVTTRSEGWWSVEVPELPGLVTQVRRLDQVEARVRDLAALLTERSEDDFEVSLAICLDPDTATEVERHSEVSEAARLLQAEARIRSRTVAHRLASAGLTVRDVGIILGISHQRAAQLLADPDAVRQGFRAEIERIGHVEAVTIYANAADQHWRAAVAHLAGEGAQETRDGARETRGGAPEKRDDATGQAVQISE